MSGENMPLAASRNGNIYKDAIDPNIVWYLPAVGLASGDEQIFRFPAAQTGPDATGNPVNECNLTFAFKKTMPNDVVSFKAQNPTLEFREIPHQKTSSSPSVQSAFFVMSGMLASCNLTPSGNDLLIFAATLKGGAVRTAYEGFRLTGNLNYFIIYMIRVLQTDGPRTIVAPGFGCTAFKPIGRVFGAQEFQLAYTVSVGGRTRYIFDLDDLIAFDAKATKFSEVTALGNVSERFPSISQLFVSRLSRGIMMIPARYVILRGRDGCAAACQAVLDTGSATSDSMFTFSFTLIPDINPVELAQLLAEVQAHPSTRGSVLEPPAAFNLADGSTLSTPFATSVRYEAGSATAHSAALSVTVKEQAGQLAVANANAFMTQLRSSREPFLTGSIKIKLDDALPTRIEVPVLLSFKQTQRIDDEFRSQLDEATGVMTLDNASVLDLLVARAALLGTGDATIVNVGQVIRSGQSIRLPLPPDQPGLSVQTDAELAVADGALSIPDFFRVLRFNAVDVQETQYLLAISADTVKFQTRAIDRIEVSITLANLSGVPAPPLLLLKERPTDSTHVLVPIVQAVTNLPAMLGFVVHFTDASKPPVRFTLQNDFVREPIFVLKDGDIAG
jgi:hypothetical protein